MHISDVGLKMITAHEGCRLQAYKPVAAEQYYTIGYGHYGPDVSKGMIITQAQAEQYLKKDIEKFEKLVRKYDNTYHWTQNEFDALVSFAYNVGSIDQLTSYGTRSKTVIANKIPAYNKGSGKVLVGLVKRRAAEQALFLGTTQIYQKPDKHTTLRKGATGDEVKFLQSCLNKNGFKIAEDGIFGTVTYTAVIAFQGLKGLVKDGVVGPKTWAELDK